MQGTGINGRKIVGTVLPPIILLLLILLDQISKTHFLTNRDFYYRGVWVIDGFFCFRFTTNSGAAFSFLADTDWGQIFFKCLTAVALVVFFFFYVFASNKNYKWLKYALIFVIGGTIGNFIDRLAYNCVVDFLSFTLFGGYVFPTFNLADAFLTVGVIMVIIHFLFLDKNALLRKSGSKDAKEKL